MWTFSPLQDAITSVCLHDTRDGSYSSGVTLREEDFPQYFEAVKRDLKIIAPDAIKHPATSCFDEVYFMPLDIRSLLDFVVLIGSDFSAVLCCEHCAEQKDWTPADMQYLQSMSTVVSLTLKQSQKAAVA